MEMTENDRSSTPPLNLQVITSGISKTNKNSINRDTSSDDEDDDDNYDDPDSPINVS